MVVKWLLVYSRLLRIGSSQKVVCQNDPTPKNNQLSDQKACQAIAIFCSSYSKTLFLIRLNFNKLYRVAMC